MLLLLLGCSVLSSFTSKAPTAPLTGHVAIDDARITVYNDGATEWSNVVATANGTLVCTIGPVHAHDQAGLNLVNCTGGPLAAPVVGVRVVADQGFLEAAAAPAVALVEPALPPDAPDAALDPAAAASAPPPGTVSPTAISRTPDSAPAATSAPPTAVSKPPPEPAATAASPAASTSAASSSSSAASTASSGAMSLSAAISGGIGPARRLTVFNNSSFGWTGCVVTANDLYSYRVSAIEAGGHNGIMMIKFKDQAGNLFTSTAQVTRVKVKCDQGTTPVVLPT